jgi:nucleotide-binding universal stress UspA family protein
MTNKSPIAANGRVREAASSEPAEHERAVFANVMVGVDGTPNGRDAIALGALLRDPDGRLTLAHVSSGPGGTTLFDPAVARAESLRLLEGERNAAGVIAELTSCTSPGVGRGLHRLAEEQDADLLVVGSCRRGLLGRVFVGDDTRASLNGASCAVAVAPRGYAEHPAAIKTIGVGYEDTAAGEGALALARRLAARHEARIRALTVVDLPSAGLAYWEPMAIGEAGEAIAATEQAAKDRLASLEGVEGRLASGVPGEELAAFGGEVDLLIVGSRGYGPVRRLMLGSTSQHLTHSGRCPLVVLPRPAVDPSAADAEPEEATSGSVS